MFINFTILRNKTSLAQHALRAYILTTVEGALRTAVSELENKQIDKTKVRNAMEEIRSLLDPI